MENNEEVTPTARFIGLIKQKRNAEVKAIIMKVLASNPKKREEPLIHGTVMHNNVELIAVLFSLGFDINKRDLSGQTPLLLAARNGSYQAVQLLLALDADVFIEDSCGVSAFRVLMNKEKNTPACIIGCLSERLKRSAVSLDKIVNELVKIDCPLDYVLKLNIAVVTREMLKREHQIDRATSNALLKLAMHSDEMDNVFVLLYYGPNAYYRRSRFVHKVTANLAGPFTKPSFKQIFKWRLIDEMSRSDIEEHFTKGNEDTVKLLLDMGIEKYFKEKFGFDVFVKLFANKTVDVAPLWLNKEFDIKNSRDENGNSALHVATAARNDRAMVYLLDNGADPNAKNRNGETPLFLTRDDDQYTELLLEGGADIQAMNDNEEIFFGDNFIFANLMIMEARGIPLNDKLQNCMHNGEIYFDMNNVLSPYTCYPLRQDLEWMKTRWVSESITLFFVLTEKYERLARYVKNEETCEEILKAIEERELKPTYVNMLKTNLQRARIVNQLRVRATAFLCDQMQIASFDHLVIRKIVGLLTYKDLLLFYFLGKADDELGKNGLTHAGYDYISWLNDQIHRGVFMRWMNPWPPIKYKYNLSC